MIVKLPCASLLSEIEIPSDKSISHRAVIFSSMVPARTEIYNILECEDTRMTINIFKRLGVSIRKDKNKRCLVVNGCGKYFKPDGRLFTAGESGTTMRLMAGLLAAQKFPSTLKGAQGLNVRPMGRVTVPLREMGADINGAIDGSKEFPPLRIKPVENLTAIEYDMPVPSAQVKSAVMLAGLYARGTTVIKEKFAARDHTERALKLFGAEIESSGNSIKLYSSRLTSPGRIFIPGDISSAAFFIALGMLRKGSDPVVLKRVGINPTRDGFLKTVKKMGARIRFKNHNKEHYEPYADIEVYPSALNGVTIHEKELPSMIDELPLVFMLAVFAKGETLIKGASELRVKETDRVESMRDNLSRMGAEVKISGQGRELAVKIKGTENIYPAEIKSYNDHRTAMAMVIAHMALNRAEVEIDNIKCIDKSFPEFFDTLWKT